MAFFYDDKEAYVLATQKEQIQFKRFQVQSQLNSVLKRSRSLVHDIYVYLAFLVIPAILFSVAFFLSFLGNTILRIVFVPAMFLCAGAIFILGPFSLYKLCVSVLMIIFSRHGGTLVIFDKVFDVYTFKMEEHYCRGKLRKLDDYIAQIEKWEADHKEGKSIPDPVELEHIFRGQDLSFEIKVATNKDPILKKFGWVGLPLMIVVYLFIAVGIWAILFLDAGSLLEGANASLFENW